MTALHIHCKCPAAFTGRACARYFFLAAGTTRTRGLPDAAFLGDDVGAVGGFDETRALPSVRYSRSRSEEAAVASPVWAPAVRALSYPEHGLTPISFSGDPTSFSGDSAGFLGGPTSLLCGPASFCSAPSSFLLTRPAFRLARPAFYIARPAFRVVRP